MTSVGGWEVLVLVGLFVIPALVAVFLFIALQRRR